MKDILKSLTTAMLTILFVIIFNAPNTKADQTIADDLIVEWSVCVGEDCVDNEYFGVDTLKLKSSSPSILFEDTSTLSGFPSNDWRIGVRSNAGSSTFYVEDVTEGSMALQMESGINGGVALGTGSTLETGTVSVGSTGNERRITNVADGIDDTDAVNMRQFNQAISDIASGFPDELDAISARQASIDRRLDNLSSEIDGVTATAAAFSAVQANPKASGNNQVSIGLGNYGSESAAAIGLYRFVASDQVMINAGLATSTENGKVASRAGMTFGW